MLSSRDARAALDIQIRLVLRIHGVVHSTMQAAMLFVPSIDSISHHSAEDTKDEDLA